MNVLLSELPVLAFCMAAGADEDQAYSWTLATQ